MSEPKFKFKVGDVVTHRAIQPNGAYGSAERTVGELRFVVVNRRALEQDEGTVVYGLAFWSDSGVRAVAEATEWELRLLESIGEGQNPSSTVTVCDPKMAGLGATYDRSYAFPYIGPEGGVGRKDVATDQVTYGGLATTGQPFHLSYTAEEMSRMSASRVVLKVGDRVRERLAPWFSYTIHSFVDVGGQVMAHGFGKRADEPWQFFHKPSDLELQEKESD